MLFGQTQSGETKHEFHKPLDSDKFKTDKFKTKIYIMIAHILTVISRMYAMVNLKSKADLIDKGNDRPKSSTH